MSGNALAYAVVGADHTEDRAWIAGVYATCEEAEAAIEENFGAIKRAREALREWEEERNRMRRERRWKHGDGDVNVWWDQQDREIVEKLGERPPTPPPHVASAYWIETVTVGHWRDQHPDDPTRLQSRGAG